jgi:hypothetical protein
MAGEKLVEKALQAAMEARAAKHVADPAERAANLARWQSGTPAQIAEPTWYHGTPREVSEFTENRPTFLTTNPEFANTFAQNETVEHVFDEASNKWRPIQDTDFAQNVMPMHVRAENPFDYENPKHIEALDRLMRERFKTDPYLRSPIPDIAKGSWETIEATPIQDALKQLGHDAYFVREGKNKNLAVYDPERQLKSATGNLGTFDPEIPRLTENRGGEVEREHHAGGKKVVDKALEAVRAKFAAGRALPEAERMIVTHNASPSAVEFYSTIGGLPAPSMGIFKPEHGADRFGSVKLVGKPEVFAVPSEANPIFPNDAYTPRLGRGHRKSLGDVASQEGKSPLDLYTEWLRMNGIRGGETGTSGAGYLRALITPEFKNVDDVLGARDRLVNMNEFAWPSQNASEEYSRLMREIRSNAFNRNFSAKNAAEIAEKGPEWLVNRWNVAPDTANEFGDYLTRLRTMPTEYFEGKPQRSVKGEDFAGALVPEGASETAKHLEGLGIGNVQFYKPSEEYYGNVPITRDALFKHFTDQMFSHGGEVREHHSNGERVKGEVSLDDIQFVSPERMADPKWDPRQIFEGVRRPMLPQDAGISAGGEGKRELGELTTAAFAPTLDVGRVSAGPLLVGVKDYEKPIVGYQASAALPEGFRVNYSSSRPVDVPSKYSSDTLSLAKEILGANLSAQMMQQGDKRGYGVGLSRGNQDGQSYINVSRPPMGGLSVMGGKEFRFADGGPVYQSTGEKLVGDENKINWGDPNEARDFFRADAERMRQEKAAEDARRTAGLPDGVTSYAPIGGGMTGGTPLLAAIRGQESSDDPNAQSKTSSAGGLFGFIDSTWANTLRRMNPELYGRMSDAELVALKKGKDTAALQQQAADYHLNQEILPTLNKAGIPATPGNAYLGWFQGAQGAVKANTLPQDARVADVFPQSVGPNANIMFNGKPYAQWTLGDLRAWADAKMASRMKREHGGEVDDALRVVREHHADGEEVGTQRQRTRAALDTLGSFEDKPPMDPAVMGENWANAVRRFRENPVREGEATMRPLELGARDVIGGMIAGDAPNTSYTTELRRRAADALVGSKGLPDSGTLGFGVADLPMVTGIPLQAADFTQSLKEGDYLGAGINAALPAAFYGRKPIAEAGRRALEIAREYAPKAAGVGTAAAVMSPVDAEAAAKNKMVNQVLQMIRAERPASSRVVSQAGEHGFFVPQGGREKDPRKWHSISNTVLSRPLGEMHAEHVITGPAGERKFIEPYELERAALIPALGDRTAGNSLLTAVNETKLANPVEMQAGNSFMFGPAAKGPDKAVWASDPGVVAGLASKTRAAAEAGYDPHLSFVTMGNRSGDYSHHMTDTLRELLPSAKVDKATIAEFDRQMRENTANKWAAYSDWPGLKSKALVDYLYGEGPAKSRTKMAELMGQGQFQKAGMPDVGAARFAITDPALLHAEDYSAGHSIAKLDPSGRVIKEPAVPHKTYKVQLGGEGPGYVGGFEYDIPFNVMNKEWIDKMMAIDAKKYENPSQLAYTYRMHQPTTFMTPEVVDRISTFLDLKKRGLIP